MYRWHGRAGAALALAGTLVAGGALGAAATPATPITLTVAFWGAEAEYNDIWVPLKQQFEQAFPHIKLELMHITGSYQDKIVTMALGGQPADVWMSNADTALESYLAGISHDLRPFIEKDRSFQLNNFFPAAVAAYNWRGVQFGFPSHFQVVSVWYNKELFGKAGLLYPRDDGSWAQLEADARKLTRDLSGDGQPDQWGLVLPLSGEFLLPWIYSAGGSVVDDLDRPTRSTLAEPAAVQGLQFVGRLITEAKVVEPGYGNAQPFYDGRVAMYPYYAVAQRMAAYAKFPYNVARFPAGPAGSVPALVPGGFVMGKGRHPQEAWELIKFIAQRGAFSYNTVPAYLPLARTDKWPFVKVPDDYNRAAFVQGALSARPHMIKSAKVAEIYRLVGQLRPALLGEEPVGTAATKIARQIDALLKE